MAEENKEKLNIRLFVYDMEMPLRESKQHLSNKYAFAS